MAIVENESSVDGKAITGKATGEKGIGVYGDGKAVGVRGDGETWHGVAGLSKSTTGGVGVYGKNTAGGTGVIGESDTWMGVYGKSVSTTGGAGIMGEGDPGPGVIGRSTEWIGVYGESAKFEGVRGTSKNKDHAGIVGTNEAGGAAVYGGGDPGPGVIGMSTKWVGVYGETAGVENGPAGVWGEHKGAGIGVKAISNTGVGLVAFSNGTAAIFQGDVEVTGDIRLTNADCAEDFDVNNAGTSEPGTVMILGEEGALQPSQRAYDKRVAGVVSGAGDYKPGIVLDKQAEQANRKPIALLGKVYCKVDASYAPVEVGDLLTTAPTPGHAMKAIDPLKAFGAVIGKAMRPLREGQGLVPILIALQ